MTRDEYKLWGAKAVARRGNSLPQSKLTPDRVREIRSNRSVRTIKQWAEHFGVSHRTIEKVKYFQTWVHVRG